MKRHDILISRILIIGALFTALMRASASAAPVFNPASFSGAMQTIDYRNSPIGLLPDSTSITNQYASLGVEHDGTTTTPPGPAGISSLSGLPGLESDRDRTFVMPIRITFTRPVTQVGAYFLMGDPNDSITITARRANSTTIETATVAPANMPLRPGPFGFNEGFIGLVVQEPIASVVFASGPNQVPFVIDDLHFGVPEPSTLGLMLIAGLIALGRIPR